MPKESAYFRVESMNDKYKFKQIKKELDTIKGVLSVSVNHENNQIAVDFDNTGVSRNHIEKSLTQMGYTVSDVIGQQHIM